MNFLRKLICHQTIYEGYSLSYAIMKQNLAGSDLTSWMTRLLIEKGHDFSSSNKKEIECDIKE